MEKWKKPSVIIYDKDYIAKTIKAKAYTTGQALTIAQLCEQGVGSSGQVTLPDGMVVDAYVASVNEVDCFFTIVINGINHIWNWITNIFS